jgi:NADPH:quinone reductase-like Zn-dependent oxidoreductase
MASDIDLLLGDECSGRITAVGKKVNKFKIGDEVIANGPGCFASHLTIPVPFVVRKPARISFEEAATIPVTFMTAWYALHHLGKIRRGENILIHAATGGVGLAAIQIAKLAGAEIFATAGNDEKRNCLHKLGIRHVMDSRSTAFAGEIRKITKGAGVDLVLNSLAGDAIAKGLSALAHGGRFLEIGKRDIYANTAIGLRPFCNNLSMFVIDMGQVMAEQPDTVQHLLQTIMKLFRAGKFLPLPRQTLPVSQAADAFRLMAQAKHIGKIVLTMQNVSVTPRRLPPKEKIKFPAKASYLITGGLGGFGLAVAKWLVASGARNLVLTGRNGAATAEAKRAVAELKRHGAKVLVIKADAAVETDVARIFKLAAQKLPPLRGLFHAAMVLDDGILPQLTAERFSRVMSPKVTGAWNLHTAAATLPLDHFVMFSSVSALVGTAGQANYVAANCFLDALAHHRHACGLPALTVNWGALGEVGFLSRNAKVAEHLTAHGVHAIAPAHATEMLGRLLQSDATQIGFMHLDWQKYFGVATEIFRNLHDFGTGKIR